MPEPITMTILSSLASATAPDVTREAVREAVARVKKTRVEIQESFLHAVYVLLLITAKTGVTPSKYQLLEEIKAGKRFRLTDGDDQQTLMTLIRTGDSSVVMPILALSLVSMYFIAPILYPWRFIKGAATGAIRGVKKFFS